jgi:ABC-type transporter Mla subunit MlaD
MEPLLAFLTQPWVVILVAIGVFVGRVVYMARRLKSAARAPLLADTRALEEAQRALEAHRESLAQARETLSGNLGDARDTLREYREPLDRSIQSRRRDLESGMKSREASKKEFEALREQKAFKDAKQILRRGSAHKPHGSPKNI